MTRPLTRINLLLQCHAIRVVASVVMLIVGGGAAYASYLGDALRYRDEREYLELAHQLVLRGVFSFEGGAATTLRPPGYPFLLSLFESAGAGLPLLRWIQFVALGACVVLIARLARRLSGPAAGAIASLLVLAYPVEFYSAGTFYPQTFAALMLLFALDLLSQTERPSAWRASLAGGCFGALILSVPTFVFSFGLVLVWFVATRPSLRTVTCLVLPVVFLIGAWTIRNYLVVGSFVFVSTNGGLNLLLGNSENTTASGGTNVDITKYERESVDMDEPSRDALFRRKALDWVARNKGAAAKLYVEKVVHYFAFRDQLATKEESSTARSFIMYVTYGPLLVLLLLRLLHLHRRAPARFEWLLLALYLCNAFFMALFFCRIRFRLPLDFLLIAIDASLVGTLLRNATQRSKGAP